ncbi:MAG: cytidylyltransferase domain-containing protein, partial [Candidatus Brocadiales bacterium]
NEAVMATLANEIKTVDDLLNPNVVKVVLDNNGYALYFSRAPIPFSNAECRIRNAESQKENIFVPQSAIRNPHLRHIGVYAYRRDFLLSYTKLPPSPLEETERLEQLRALSNGYKIKVSITPFECVGIDTEEDLERFLKNWKARNSK